MQEEPQPQTTSLIVVSDFVCPWCYVGLSAAQRVIGSFDVELRFAPYLLDPSTPPEGKPRRHPEAPAGMPSHLEQRGSDAGITFTRGRTWQSNSHLALEAAEMVGERHPQHALAFHLELFRSYFTDLVDIGKAEEVIAAGERAGVPGDDLRSALELRAYREQVDDGVQWAREVGVTGVPTYIFNEKYAVVGAQEWPVFEQVMSQLETERAAS